MLVVVVRPARARAVLPVALVLAGALVITAIIDLVDRRIPLTGGATHLPELLSVVTPGLLTRPICDLSTYEMWRRVWRIEASWRDGPGLQRMELRCLRRRIQLRNQRASTAESS